MYRKGIYGHSQMLRVNLRKALSAGIVSGKKKKNENKQILTSKHRSLNTELNLRESISDFAHLKNLSNILSMTCLGPVP